MEGKTNDNSVTFWNAMKVYCEKIFWKIEEAFFFI